MFQFFNIKKNVLVIIGSETAPETRDMFQTPIFATMVFLLVGTDLVAVQGQKCLHHV